MGTLAAAIAGAYRSGNSLIKFNASLVNSLFAKRGGTPTFSRASGATVIDHEGNIRLCDSHEARFEGARRVKNLVASTLCDSADWNIATAVDEGRVADPDGGMQATRYSSEGGGGSFLLLKDVSLVINRNYSNSIWLRGSLDPAATVGLYNGSGATSISPTQITSVWQQFSVTAAALGASGYSGILINSAGANSWIEVFLPKGEDVSGLAATASSEDVTVLQPTSNELNPDAGIEAGATNYDISGGNLSFVTSAIHVDAISAGGANSLQLDPALHGNGQVMHTGKTYQVEITIENFAAIGSPTSVLIDCAFGDTYISPTLDILAGGNGVYTVKGVCGSTSAIYGDLYMDVALGVGLGNEVRFDITNISIRECDHGLNDDAVKAFAVTNPNTVTNNIVTVGTSSALATLKGYLTEPSRANKCMNFNAQPVDRAWTSGGGAIDGVAFTDLGTGATLDVVNDIALLTSAGLLSIGNGRAFVAYGGDTGSTIIINGTTNNTNPHVSSIWARCDVETFFGITGQVTVSIPVSGSYQRLVSPAQTPALTTDQFRIAVPALGTVYFVLNQLEEGNFVTSEIPTAGAAALRLIDNLSYEITNLNLNEGSIVIEVTPHANGTAFPADALIIKGASGETDSILQIDSATGFYQAIDGITVATSTVQALTGVTNVIAVAWSVTDGTLSISVDGEVPVEANGFNGFSLTEFNIGDGVFCGTVRGSSL